MLKKISLIAASLLLSAGASATPLSGTDGTGNPPVPGATAIVDFEGQGNTSFASLTLGGVTFSGIGGNLRTSSMFAGQYNGRGAYYLDNNQGGTNGIRFDFGSLVNGFAFNFGASDDTWILSAYDSAGNLIESVAAPIVNASNLGDYVGLSDAGIQYAILSTAGSFDWVFIDNVTYAAGRTANVAEPGSLVLFGAALAGLACARRRKSPSA